MSHVYNDVIRKVHYIGTQSSKVLGARRGPSVWVVTKVVSEQFCPRESTSRV